MLGHTLRGSHPQPARVIGYFPKRSANTWPVQAPRRRFGGVRALHRRRRTTMVRNLTRGAVPRANGAGRLFRSTPSRLIPGAYTTSTVMSGSGRRTVGALETRVIQAMGAHEIPVIARNVF